MTRKKIVLDIAEITGIPESDCDRVLSVLGDEIASGLIKDGKVLLSGLCSIKVRERPKQQYKNPRTGEVMDIPAVKMIKFSPAKAIKDAVKAGQCL